MTPSIMDLGQDLKGETLVLFQLGNINSGASSANETEQDEWPRIDSRALYSSSSNSAPHLLPALGLDSPKPLFNFNMNMSRSAADAQDDPLFLAWFNMDIDDFGTSPSSPQMSLLPSLSMILAPVHLSHLPSVQDGGFFPAASSMISSAHLNHSPSLQSGSSFLAAPLPYSSSSSLVSL